MGLELRDIFRVWFALTLVVTFLAIGLLTHIGAGLHCVGLLAERSHHTFSVLCSCLGFRFLLLVNPQIRVTHVGDWDGLTEQGAKMILMNHTSFMDFFLFTAALPLRLVKSSHVRTVISSSLTKIPILGPAMGSHAGSFVVYFQAKGSGFGKGDATDFSVDREKQQVQTDRMNAHIEAGGAIAFCPEGGMNKAPADGLQPFRRGSFAQAVKYHTPVWGAALYGCTDCWPRNGKVGGFPARLGVSVDKLMTPTADQDAAAVAASCQAAMQRQLDEFTASMQPKAKGL